MEHIDHLPFIVSSYAAAAIVIGLLIVWIMLDYRIQRRALTNLETRGITRRSTPAGAERTVARAEENA